jgi:hypothetical protein
MELMNMKQKEIKRVEVYYERIQKLVHGLQVLTIYNFLTTIRRTCNQLQNCDFKDEAIKTTTT